jgi:hypothetical protein
MSLLRMLVATAVLVFGLVVPATATATDEVCPPNLLCLPDLHPDSDKVCYFPGDPCTIDVDNRWGPVMQRVTVHYRTFTTGSAPADYFMVQDAELTIEPGQSGGHAPIALVPHPPVPVERFGVEVFAPSVGTVSDPRVIGTIMVRG